MEKIGLGGGCHWCTEAIFQALKGVFKVEQGWIASDQEFNTFSEGIILHFDSTQIDLSILITIHLHTHSSTSDHTMRSKYRSAVYTFSEQQSILAKKTIVSAQASFNKPIITKVISFKKFKLNKEDFLNYYLKNTEKPFCQSYIDPKLKLLIQKLSKQVDTKKLTRFNASL